MFRWRRKEGGGVQESLFLPKNEFLKINANKTSLFYFYFYFIFCQISFWVGIKFILDKYREIIGRPQRLDVKLIFPDKYKVHPMYFL